MIDVSHVLEFSTTIFPQLYLLKQLPTTKITNISTLKSSLNRSRLFGGERLFHHAWISETELVKDKIKVLELSMQELQEFKLLSHEEQFLLDGFQ